MAAKPASGVKANSPAEALPNEASLSTNNRTSELAFEPNPAGPPIPLISNSITIFPDGDPVLSVLHTLAS